MNGINRRGQKVVCVMEFEIADPEGNVYRGPQPVLDGVYTVIDFIDNGRHAISSDGDVRPGLDLLEVPGLRAPRNPVVRFGWPIIGFRPMVEDERKTDISELRKIAESIRQPEDA